MNVRRKGAGQRPYEEQHPDAWPKLEKLIDPITRGDPESPLRWTCKSTSLLAAEMFAQHGIRASDKTVGKMLRDHGYSLQAPTKSVEGAQHPDRNAQFEHTNTTAETCIKRGIPVISVDTKKKELVGNFKNGGREWQPKGVPDLVDVHDFPSDAIGKATRTASTTSPATMASSTSAPTMTLRCSRSRPSMLGGSTWVLSAIPMRASCSSQPTPAAAMGYRARVWKVELQRLADKLGISIRVSHFPPGTSKWNKVEHRLFSFISINGVADHCARTRSSST